MHTGTAGGGDGGADGALLGEGMGLQMGHSLERRPESHAGGHQGWVTWGRLSPRGPSAPQGLVWSFGARIRCLVGSHQVHPACSRSRTSGGLREGLAHASSVRRCIPAKRDPSNPNLLKHMEAATGAERQEELLPRKATPRDPVAGEPRAVPTLPLGAGQAPRWGQAPAPPQACTGWRWLLAPSSPADVPGRCAQRIGAPSLLHPSCRVGALPGCSRLTVPRPV